MATDPKKDKPEDTGELSDEQMEDVSGGRALSGKDATADPPKGQDRSPSIEY